MSDLKTRPTRASVDRFLASIEHPRRRADARTLLPLFERVTGSKARMWGESIVGFGEYHYVYASGREGDWPVTGFSPRKQNLSIYIMPGFSDYQDLLGKLGKHKHSVSCLYINKLDDIDPEVLEALIAASVSRMQTLYDCQL